MRLFHGKFDNERSLDNPQDHKLNVHRHEEPSSRAMKRTTVNRPLEVKKIRVTGRQ